MAKRRLNPEVFEPGDVLIRRSQGIADLFGIRHLGVYAGDGDVIHAQISEGRVVKEPLERFARGFDVSRRAVRVENPQMAVERALSQLDRPYSLFGVGGVNCDQLAHYAARENPESPQLRNAATAAVIGVSVGILTFMGVLWYQQSLYSKEVK